MSKHADLEQLNKNIIRAAIQVIERAEYVLRRPHQILMGQPADMEDLAAAVARRCDAIQAAKDARNNHDQAR